MLWILEFKACIYLLLKFAVYKNPHDHSEKPMHIIDWQDCENLNATHHRPLDQYVANWDEFDCFIWEGFFTETQ